MSLICKIKNGEVWRGQLGEIFVVVKVFFQNYKYLYQNEKYIYFLFFIEYENLLKFYGIDERQNVEGFWQYMIVLFYVSKGSFYGYLQYNTIDWEIFCNMCQSIVKGMVYFYIDMRIGGKDRCIIFDCRILDVCIYIYNVSRLFIFYEFMIKYMYENWYQFVLECFNNLSLRFNQFIVNIFFLLEC